MTSLASRIPNWAPGFMLIGVAFLSLYFLPPVLRTKTYSVGAPSSATGRTDHDFQMNREFPFVQLTNGKALASQKRTLETFIKQSGRKTLLVNLWATWCPPCIDELPSLEHLGRQLAASEDKNLPLLVTISVDEGLAEIGSLSGALDFRPTFPILHDPSGDFSTEMGTTRFPETYWVSETGEVLYKWLGPQDWLSQDVLDRLTGRV